MPTESRRSSSRPSRSKRRSGASTYTTPQPAVRSPGIYTTPRRFVSAEPAPVDYTREFGFVRYDLRRILLIASVLIIALIVLAFVLRAF
ncbi:MAG: hypothetical protein NVS4B8_26710 [Herpetosiphon sp.]